MQRISFSPIHPSLLRPAYVLEKKVKLQHSPYVPPILAHITIDQYQYFVNLVKTQPTIPCAIHDESKKRLILLATIFSIHDKGYFAATWKSVFTTNQHSTDLQNNIINQSISDIPTYAYLPHLLRISALLDEKNDTTYNSTRVLYWSSAMFNILIDFTHQVHISATITHPFAKDLNVIAVVMIGDVPFEATQLIHDGYNHFEATIKDLNFFHANSWDKLYLHVGVLSTNSMDSLIQKKDIILTTDATVSTMDYGPISCIRDSILTYYSNLFDEYVTVRWGVHHSHNPHRIRKYVIWNYMFYLFLKSKMYGTKRLVSSETYDIFSKT